MLKIFLVEDEAIIREGIKNSIDWEKEGFQFVGEAGDGELAYPMIKKTRPDILITDIQMPFMDGLELSSAVKKELPSTKIIILSGYGEFEYAKKAIDIGVTNYLLKPISSAKLLESIKDVAEAIEKERRSEEIIKKYETDAKENNQIEKEKLLSLIALGNISSADAIEQGRKLGVMLDGAQYKVMLFKYRQKSFSEECIKNIYKAENDAYELMTRRDRLEFFRYGLIGFCLIFKGDADCDATTECKTFCKSLIEIADKYDDIGYYGGAGETVIRLGDIKTSFINAGKAYAGRFFTNDSKILFYDENEENNRDLEMDIEKFQNPGVGKEQVVNFLRNGSPDELDTFLETYFKSVGEKNINSLIFRQYIAIDLLVITAGFLNDIGIASSEYPQVCAEFGRASFITEISSSPLKLKEHIKSLLASALEIRDRFSGKKYAFLLNSAKEYIKNNYNKEISLNTVASFVNISPSYLSTIFRQETSQTFSEYITQIRIDKAKELLKCTSLRSSEIGYEVGYKDSHYFSNIFKKTVGCAPKEFRAKGRE